MANEPRLGNISFRECDPPATVADITAAESLLGIRFPAELRWVFLNANGGRPVPSTVRLASGVMVINMILSVSDVLWYHNAKIVEQEVAPLRYVPFAVDPGGEFILIDPDVDGCPVYIHRHDTTDESLEPAGIGIAGFFASFFSED